MIENGFPAGCNGNRDTTLCFSGHRRYAGVREDEARLDEAVEGAYRNGYRIFISGVAAGFDLAAAEAALRLRERHPDVKLIAAVPFRGHSAGCSADVRRRYGMILAAAGEVAVLSENYSHGCFYERDDWMTARSSRLICWYDGSAGGTRYTVRSALRGRLRIVNVYKESDTLF